LAHDDRSAVVYSGVPRCRGKLQLTLFLMTLIAFSSAPSGLWNITIYQSHDPVARERAMRMICRQAALFIKYSHSPRPDALVQRFPECTAYWPLDFVPDQ
jgi:hypothetical protein